MQTYYINTADCLYDKLPKPNANSTSRLARELKFGTDTH